MSDILATVCTQLTRFGGIIVFKDEETYTVEPNGTTDGIRITTVIDYDEQFMMFTATVIDSNNNVSRSVDVYRVDDIKSIIISEIQM